jgi:hypothetical protein
MTDNPLGDAIEEINREEADAVMEAFRALPCRHRWYAIGRGEMKPDPDFITSTAVRAGNIDVLFLWCSRRCKARAVVRLDADEVSKYPAWPKGKKIVQFDQPIRWKDASRIVPFVFSEV